MEHGFTWVSIIPGLNLLPDHTATAFLVTAGLIAWALLARRQMQSAADVVVPDATLTARNALEVLVEGIAGIAHGVLGKQSRNYLHLYGAFFLFILVSNLIGLVPGFSPPTSNFNVTFGLGIISFVMYNFFGIHQHGIGYLKHFLGPVMPLAPLMLVLELIDNFIRPVTLGLRLAANLHADHMVLEIFTNLTYVIVPVAFYVLGAFVCVVQTFVFTLLSLVYLSLATAGHGDHAEHEGEHHAAEHH